MNSLRLSELGEPDAVVASKHFKFTHFPNHRGEDLSEEEMRSGFKEVDLNGDGAIDFVCSLLLLLFPWPSLKNFF